MSAPRIVVVGAGAAGIAAGRRLRASDVTFLILEARDRVGGRAHTVTREGWPLDLGCGWLHRSERNAWAEVFRADGVPIDHAPPPWGRPALTAGFSLADQRDFQAAFAALEDRLAAAAERPDDSAASDQLQPGGRWSALLNAFSAAYNGAAFDRISVKDYAAFDEGEAADHRVPSGYGAAIAGAAAGLPVRLNAAVARIAHGGPSVRLELEDGGVVEAEAAVVTLPTSLLAREAVRFEPPLPHKAKAAAGLPLGFAGKVFLHLEGAERDFAPESLLYGSATRTRTASFHIRPFGRPLVESYFGGETAEALEAAGPDAAADACIGLIVDALGSAVRRRLRPLAATAWSVDACSHGAYSHALPGRAADRAVLARPEGRVLFAGEACSPDAYSTAHGAYETGVAAAEAALAAIGAGHAGGEASDAAVFTASRRGSPSARP